MSGLSSIMDTSLSALYAAQAGLATTGHNIANANTPGYSRQTVLYAARRPDLLPYGAIGRGVEVQGIRRIQDDFLLNNLRAQSARYESYAAMDTTLYEIEAIMGSVDNDHLGDALNNFFNSWNALAQPPVNTSLKEDVVTNAVSLVNDFHSVSDSLDDLEADIEVGIQSEIANLNRLLTQVADMNKQIMASETNGEPANDLRDQRDYLITEVSKIAQVSVHEREDGTKDVILAGRTMVVRDSVTLFEPTYEKTADGYQMTIVTQGTLQKVALSDGKLSGLLESRDTHVASVREQLDAVAAQLIEDVNALHTQGRTSLSSGQAFFTGDSMHTIGVNEAILANSDLVAMGRSGADGDTALAQEIADLANAGRGGVGTKSVTDNYRAFLTNVASKRASYEFMVENQQNVVASLETRLASVAGVSLDEEGANMVKFQNSYNAAAKVISTVQELYDTLLNMV
ncbi:MAG: flagellar hook-associated protein FlgK [Candidatus Krumholzibacteriia bacterium]